LQEFEHWRWNWLNRQIEIGIADLTHMG